MRRSSNKVTKIQYPTRVEGWLDVLGEYFLLVPLSLHYNHDFDVGKDGVV
jgi:hypothetical protein